MKRYVVNYHTQPAPGLTYYQGKVEVWAEDDMDAEENARREIYRGSFPDRWPSNIVIDSVSRKLN